MNEMPKPNGYFTYKTWKLVSGSMPGDLSRTIRTLHRQNEPPLPSQPTHHAGYHHRSRLRAALHGTDFCADV